MQQAKPFEIACAHDEAALHDALISPVVQRLQCVMLVDKVHQRSIYCSVDRQEFVKAISGHMQQQQHSSHV